MSTTGNVETQGNAAFDPPYAYKLEPTAGLEAAITVGAGG